MAYVPSRRAAGRKTFRVYLRASAIAMQNARRATDRAKTLPREKWSRRETSRDHL